MTTLTLARFAFSLPEAPEDEELAMSHRLRRRHQAPLFPLDAPYVVLGWEHCVLFRLFDPEGTTVDFCLTSLLMEDWPATPRFRGKSTRLYLMSDPAQASDQAQILYTWYQRDERTRRLLPNKALDLGKIEERLLVSTSEHIWEKKLDTRAARREARRKSELTRWSAALTTLTSVEYFVAASLTPSGEPA